MLPWILPEEILPADAVVNPKMLVPDNGCKSIPGAGVAYLVSKALQDRLGVD
jgi:single-stranded DNA-specific DHH superfamily exonuclease